MFRLHISGSILEPMTRAQAICGFEKTAHLIRRFQLPQVVHLCRTIRDRRGFDRHIVVAKCG